MGLLRKIFAWVLRELEDMSKRPKETAILGFEPIPNGGHWSEYTPPPSAAHSPVLASRTQQKRPW